MTKTRVPETASEWMLWLCDNTTNIQWGQSFVEKVQPLVDEIERLRAQKYPADVEQALQDDAYFARIPRAEYEALKADAEKWRKSIGSIIPNPNGTWTVPDAELGALVRKMEPYTTLRHETGVILALPSDSARAPKDKS